MGQAVDKNIIQNWIHAADLNVELKSNLVYSNDSLKKSNEAVLSLFDKAYKRNPFRKTIGTETIMDQLKWSADWTEVVLSKMEVEGQIIQCSGGVILSSYEPEITAKDQKDLDLLQNKAY